MSARGRAFLTWMGLGMAFFLAYRVQKEIDRGRNLDGTAGGSIYIHNPEWLRRLSMGYETLLADVYWMRAVQYYGQKSKRVEKQTYDLLYPMLNLAASLDPQMTTVYRFGAMFLAESQPMGPGEPWKAIQLLNQGIKHNPNTWRFYFDKGFVYLWHLKDHKSAGRCFLEGSHLPGAPKWLDSLAATALGDSGELEIARNLWMRECDEAENESVRSNARNHLDSLQVDEDRWRLEFLVAKYQEKTGRMLTNLSQLVNAGFIRRIPSDPSGVPYEYDRDLKGVYPGRGSKVSYFPLKDDARAVYWKRLEAEWQGGARTAGRPKEREAIESTRRGVSP